MILPPPGVEPFRIKVVEPLRLPDPAEREAALRAARYNMFRIPSGRVFVDLLTDSGTGAMSDRQWAGMMMGDESYAGSRNFDHFESVVRDLTGFEHVIPTHQGRAAEHLVMSELVRAGDVVPSNSHFDTTRAHVEHRGATAMDLPCPEAADPESEFPFKGNMDLRRLEESLRGPRVPLAIMTLTNNTRGGHAASLENLIRVRDIVKRRGVPFFIDACRYAENAYFIRQQEASQRGRPLADIARDIFALADGCWMSAKKDGLVNIGGFIAVRDAGLAERLKNLLILMEGFPTYGGLARRDLEAMAIGLREGLDEAVLAHGIQQVARLGARMAEAGVPVIHPFGGHAVYIDAARFLPHLPPDAYPAESLASALYLEGAVRTCGLGRLAFGDAWGREMVRMAIPRRAYTCCHLEYAADAVIRVRERRGGVPGLRLVEAPATLRHFSASFEPVGGDHAQRQRRGDSKVRRGGPQRFRAGGAPHAHRR